MYKRFDPTNVGLSIVAASVLTAAGGSMDAWVYMDHGHVFANAQTGNVVLIGVHVASGDFTSAAQHVPPIMAFIFGLVSSSLTGKWLKKAALNSRNVRLTVECVILAALALIAGHLPNGAVTACIGFTAAVQITSFSHIGDVTFNTGMTTGNLRGAFSAASEVLYEPASKKDRTRAVALGSMCLAFAVGAALGGFFTLHSGDQTLFVTAGMVGLAALLMWRTPDPIPSCPELLWVPPFFTITNASRVLEGDKRIEEAARLFLGDQTNAFGHISVKRRRTVTAGSTKIN
jgi:uncharacterized membrane protein YoaK (UPF0700 family)